MAERDGLAGPDSTRNEVVGEVAGNLVQARDIGRVDFYGPAPAPPPAQVPRQLPPPLPHFVDRVPQFAELSARLGSELPRVAPAVFVISGAPGVGKAAFGTQWAHTVSEQFPDGQLYADLEAAQRGGPADIGDVLHGFLRDLGVHEEWIPAAADRRAALFRTRTAELRILVVASGVRYPAQLRQLVPGSPSGALLVTAGRRVGALLADADAEVELRPLDAEAGVQYLRRTLGDARVAEDPGAAERLAALCGGLPMALRVAAARLRPHRDRPLRRLVAELENPSGRLAGLTADGDPGVTAVLDSALRGLSPAAAHAYRLLSLLPGSDFSAPCAAVLLAPGPDSATGPASATASASGPGATGRLLDELLEACLLDEAADGRYSFHGLTRLHARERADRDEDPARCGAAVDRVLSWYLTQAYRADRVALGTRLRVGGPPFDTPPARPAASGSAAPDAVEAPDLPDDAAALDWLEAERANLLAAQRLAVERGLDALAWRMCEPLWALFLSRKHYADWIESQTVARDAAARLGDALGEAQARKQLAAALRDLGRLDEAAAEAGHALELADRAGHERMRASVLEALGKIRFERGELEDAAAAFEEARAVNQRLGIVRGVLLQEHALGRVLLAQGRHGEAYELLGRVLEGMAAFDGRNQARVSLDLAQAAAALGRHEEASRLLERAAGLYRRRGEPSGEIRALEALVGLAGAVKAGEPTGLSGAAGMGGRAAARRSLVLRIIELYEAGGAAERAEPYRRMLVAEGLTP